MGTLLAILIGSLFASGLYMILRRSIIKLIIGLSLLSHGCNLLIFSVIGVVRGNLPIIEKTQQSAPLSSADPLPQALILTAIVISFGITAFTIILLRQVYQKMQIKDTDQLKETDKLK